MIRALLIWTFAAASLFSMVKEVAHFNELTEHITAETVVLLDIDDTLITPTQMLGCDTWFELRIRKYQLEGYDFSPALEKALSEWEAIQHLSRMELVEPEISEILSQIQNRGVPVMGITARGLALATRSVLQLRDHEIDLSKTSPHAEDYCFPMEGHTVLFRQGILFTSGKSKGASFFHLCEKMGKTPKRIIAMDDKLSHLQNMEKEALKRGVEFVGLRYSFSDQRKAAFSQEVADYQMSHSTFIYLLSDSEAIEKLRGKPPLLETSTE